MQLNTTTALVTTVVSSVIGFGLAFYIDRRISSRMPKKSQKILTSIAMTSFGYGLMASINEVISFPLQGLHLNYDKLAGYVVANMLFLPIIFLAVAKLIGLKNKAVDVDLGVQSSPVAGNSFKSIFLIAGALLIAFFGYAAFEGDASGGIYDFYTKADYKNCNSPFEVKPRYSLKFLFKKDTNEIFMTAEFEDDGVKKQQIQKLDNCSVLDSKNWTCGGEWTGSFRSPTYMFIDGAFAYDKGFSTVGANCDVKFIKR